MHHAAAGNAVAFELPAEITKTNNARKVRIRDPRLRAVLEMLRHDPQGEPPPASAFVFGNEVGERVKSFRAPWEAACRLAGIVGLRFYDLRREFGSRLIESGAGLHLVREALGHGSVTTTNRYLSADEAGMAAALDRLAGVQPTTPTGSAPRTTRYARLAALEAAMIGASSEPSQVLSNVDAEAAAGSAANDTAAAGASLTAAVN